MELYKRHITPLVVIHITIPVYIVIEVQSSDPDEYYLEEVKYIVYKFPAIFWQSFTCKRLEIIINYHFYVWNKTPFYHERPLKHWLYNFVLVLRWKWSFLASQSLPPGTGSVPWVRDQEFRAGEDDSHKKVHAFWMKNERKNQVNSGQCNKKNMREQRTRHYKSLQLKEKN